MVAHSDVTFSLLTRCRLFAQKPAIRGDILLGMRRMIVRLVIAVATGVALVTSASFLQPRFAAGSIPDLLCELTLMPGKLLAVPFHDRGTASPEFLWRSRTLGSVILALISFLVLPAEKVSAKVSSD
jgi:hypothetical protein